MRDIDLAEWDDELPLTSPEFVAFVKEQAPSGCLLCTWEDLE